MLATIAPRRGNREVLLAQGKTSTASGTLGIDAQQANALKGQKQTPRNDAAALSGRMLLTTVYRRVSFASLTCPGLQSYWAFGPFR